MGKQRTPQGRSIGRRGPPNAPTPSKVVEAAAPEAALHPASDPVPAALPEPTPEPLHARLMDTVSPEAIVSAAPASASPSMETPVPADANLAEPAAFEPPSFQDVAPPASEATPAPISEAVPVLQASPVSEVPPALEVLPVVEASSAPSAPAAYTNVVSLKSAAPARPSEPAASAAVTEAPVQLSDGALPSPASWRAGRRPVTPLRQDLEGMGETLFAFMRNESSAVLTHLNALKDARSPADAIRLQVTEIQRAADATLSCWSEIARRATRIVAQR